MEQDLTQYRIFQFNQLALGTLTLLKHCKTVTSEEVNATKNVGQIDRINKREVVSHVVSSQT